MQKYTIIYQTAWNFSHDDHNKVNNWIFNINEICISNKNQTIQWPTTFDVCRARFCSKQNTHFNKEDSVLKNSIWKFNVTHKYYSNGIAYRCLLSIVFRRYITVHVFCKICREILIERTLITIGQCIWWLSVWYANFIDFEDPIDICLEIVMWKFKPARWSEVSRCLENDSKINLQENYIF